MGLNPEQMKNNKNVHAEIMIELEQYQIESERQVIQIDEVFGAVAGVFDLLIGVIMLILGGYYSFVSRTRLIRVLYKLD